MLKAHASGIILLLNCEHEAPRSKLRGIKAELRRSQPVFSLTSFDAVRPAIHPCSKLRVFWRRRINLKSSVDAMNQFKKSSSKWILPAFAFSVYYLIVGYKLLRWGIHGDGIEYASVARNLAEGWGSFWQPYLDDTIHPVFHEHPPLVFWIQSIFFKLFGDGIHFEAFYGFFAGILILFCTALIWRQVRRDFKLESVGIWWPILLLLSLPMFTYLSQVNRIVYTFAIFAVMATYFSYMSIAAAKHAVVFSLLAGILIYLGFIAKGPAAFFTFAVPALGWLALRIKFSRAIVATLLALAAFALLFAGTSYLYPESLQFWKKFWQAQVMSSLASERSPGDTRWYIPERWAAEMIVAVMIAVFFKFITKTPLRRIRFNRPALFFLLVALAGSLPFLISLRQHARYIFQSFPFYVLSLAFCTDTIAANLETILAEKRKIRLAFGAIAVLFCMLGAVTMFYHKDNIARHRAFYKDFYLQNIQLPERTTVSVCSQEMIMGEWLFADMQRFYKVSLSVEKEHEYLIIDKDIHCQVPENYQKIHQQPTLKYVLYRRKGS
jgi:hypothetical protein